jgi:hypothetical protein
VQGLVILTAYNVSCSEAGRLKLVTSTTSISRPHPDRRASGANALNPTAG